MSERLNPRLAGDGDGEEEKGGDKLLERMLESRTVIVSKSVDDKLARDVIGQLLILEQDDVDKPITVIVNSPGGSADSGFAIYDAIRFVKPTVRTITMGMCASAAVMIHLAAEKGNRFATPTSRFLLHQPSMRSMGQASDLEIMSSEIDRLKAVYNTIVAEATGRSVENVDADVNRDFWLSAEAAVEYGLADRILTHRGEMD